MIQRIDRARRIRLEIRQQEPPLGRIALCRGNGNPQADVVDAVLVHVRSHRSFTDTDRKQCGDNGVLVTETVNGQVEEERIVLVGAQIVQAVPVKVARDRVAENAAGDHRIRKEIAVGVQMPVDAIKDGDFIVRIGHIEIACHGQTVNAQFDLRFANIKRAIQIIVDSQQELAVMLAVRGQYVEHSRPGIVAADIELAGQPLVAGRAELECQVSVRGIRVFGIPTEVPVRVHRDRSAGVVAQLRPAVHGEPGHKITARLAIPAREQRGLVRFDGVALPVQVLARRIRERIGDRQRETIVGQRFLEFENDAGGGHLLDHHRIVDHDHVGDGNHTVVVPNQPIMPGLRGDGYVQGSVEEAGEAFGQVLDANCQAGGQRRGAVGGRFGVEQIVARVVCQVDVGDLRAAGIDRDDGNIVDVDRFRRDAAGPQQVALALLHADGVRSGAVDR